MTDTTTPISSVYIVEADSQGWIIGRLMRDLVRALTERGIVTRIGPAGGYAEEDVVFNSLYLTPLYDPRARVNSMFITHIDDRIREAELRRSFGRFNSYVCISPHDAEFVSGIRGDGAGVIGIELPPRDLSVRPIRLALFTARYEDKRKNEDWLIEYLANRPAEARQRFILCFLGADWEGFCSQLAEIDVNYEIYRYSRVLPNEYGYYKEVLARCDAMLYLGFDGGAMSVYDAISAGIDVIATDISYHRGLGDSVRLFSNKQAFFDELDRISGQHESRQSALANRSVSQYASRLLDHWSVCAGVMQTTEHVLPNKQVVDEFRERYHKIGYSRLRSAAIRFIEYMSLR